MDAENLSKITFYAERIEETYNTVVSQIAINPSKFTLTAVITMEAVQRALRDQYLIEQSHPRIKGSDDFKIVGYITYWIAKLKPVAILEVNPNEEEILINEHLAIAFATAYFYSNKNLNILSKKLVDDLKYLLRYRTLTVRIMPLIYESYVTGYWEGANQQQKAVIDSLRNKK